MHRDFAQYFVDPVTKEPLHLTVTHERDGQVQRLLRHRIDEVLCEVSMHGRLPPWQRERPARGRSTSDR